MTKRAGAAGRGCRGWRFGAALAVVLGVGTGGAEEVRCASAESMDHLMRAWSTAFTAGHAGDDARITLRTKFSAEAFDALLRGEVDVAPFARELFPGELARFRAKFQREPLLLPVAMGSRDTKGGTHAIAIFVNARNPVARLTLAQVREIFSHEGAITEWGQLGLGGKWSGRRIVPHGMIRRRESGEPPGIVNFLEQRLLAGRPWSDVVQEHADTSGGPQALEQIVQAVAADEAAIGYSGFGYAVSGAKTVALAESEAGPFFAGTAKEVARADYPLARRLYLCVSDRQPRGALGAFLTYVLTEAGQRAAGATPEKFFPLPPMARSAARALLAQ